MQTNELSKTVFLNAVSRLSCNRGTKRNVEYSCAKTPYNVRRNLRRLTYARWQYQAISFQLHGAAGFPHHRGYIPFLFTACSLYPRIAKASRLIPCRRFTCQITHCEISKSVSCSVNRATQVEAFWNLALKGGQFHLHVSVSSPLRISSVFKFIVNLLLLFNVFLNILILTSFRRNYFSQLYIVIPSRILVTRNEYVTQILCFYLLLLFCPTL